MFTINRLFVTVLQFLLTAVLFKSWLPKKKKPEQANKKTPNNKRKLKQPPFIPQLGAYPLTSSVPENTQVLIPTSARRAAPQNVQRKRGSSDLLYERCSIKNNNRMKQYARHEKVYTAFQKSGYLKKSNEISESCFKTEHK